MSGESSVTWKPDPAAAQAAILSGSAAGMAAAMQALLDMANELVPVRTGALQSSGVASSSDDGTAGAVSYGTNEDTAFEAVIQHERLDYSHPNGQSKFLEQPLFSGKDALLQVLAGGISEAMH